MAGKITIDEECIAITQCAMAAPGIIGVDDHGQCIVLPNKEHAGDNPLVQEAISVCPTASVSISD